MKYLLYIILSVFLFCKTVNQATVVSNSKRNWVKGEGRSQIYQNDLAHAKDRALRDAKKDAISRKLGDLVSSHTIVESGIWIKGEVSSKTEGLVDDYSIVSEMVEGDIVHIDILAHVKESLLVSQVNTMLADWEKPVLLTIVEERYGNDIHNNATNYTTIELNSYFLQKGFDVQDETSLQSTFPKKNTSTILNWLENNNSNFDLLLFGTVVCSNKGPLILNGSPTVLQSVDISFSLSLVDVHTHRLISSQNYLKPNVHNSFEVACKNGIRDKSIPEVAPLIFSDMVSKWGREYGSGQSILIELTGTFNYPQIYKLQTDISNEVRGVINIIERSFETTKVVWEVIYRGKVSDFTEELLNKEFDSKLSFKSKQATRLFIEVK